MDNENTTEGSNSPTSEKFVVAIVGFAAAFVVEELVKKGAKAAFQAYRNR